MLDSILSILSSANLHWVLFGTMLLGVVSGLLSVMTVLRQQSLVGDVISHAALPGICLSYIVFGTKSVPVFLFGAIISGLIASLLIQWIVQSTKLRLDAALAIVLSFFFALGIALLSLIQRNPDGNIAGIDRFLFGQAASLVPADLWLIGFCMITVMIIIFAAYKELKIICFHHEYAASIGIPVNKFHFLMIALIAIVVVIGIQIVGVILMVALLITPALTARYWTNRFSKIMILSATFGGLSGGFGTLISVALGDIPTGPTIILTAVGMFILSALFAPARGWLARRLYQ
jgi:manganese/zinc/iron transport system permease protein